MANILIFGYGRVGRTIANNLDFKKEDIVIADYNEDACERAKEDGFTTILSNLEQDEDLISVGVGSTIKYLYCVGGDDDLNIFITLTARFLDKNLQIMARAEDANSKAKLILAGANDTIDFNAIAAHKISGLLVAPLVYKLLEGVVYKHNEIFFKYNITMEELTVHENSKLIGKSLMMLDLKNSYNIILIGVYSAKRGFTYNIDKMNRSISKFDVLVVMGTEDNIKRLADNI
ncbi:MAG: hypothetical protein RL154_1654 [Pseudomonadota bacterium]